MDGQQARRSAENEALFRSVNQRLVALIEAFAALDELSVFVCECSRMDCIEQVEMTLAEYARVRSNPRWFAVAPAAEHVAAGLERVLERTERYFLVEKLDSV